jgi:hypothetical protein
MSNNGALSIDGERTSGQDIRAQNGASASTRRRARPHHTRTPLLTAASPPFSVTACVALANIVKSSLGPVGLDKMLVRLCVASPAPAAFVRASLAPAKTQSPARAPPLPPSARRVHPAGGLDR